MCGIWDWQSAIVKDLNNSQPRTQTYGVLSQKRICRDLRAFFRQRMYAFYPFKGGGSPNADIFCFLYRFFSHEGFPKIQCFTALTNLKEWLVFLENKGWSCSLPMVINLLWWPTLYLGEPCNINLDEGRQCPLSLSLSLSLSWPLSLSWRAMQY